MDYDVIVVGGGPAGATCGAFCARAGLRTVILERSTFPREKVCGDCINPGAWETFDQLGISDRVSRMSHGLMKTVRFADFQGRALEVPVTSGREFLSIKRSLFDDLLLNHARESGAEVRTGVTVKSAKAYWSVETDHGVLTASTLVAADGRNSSVARSLNLLPEAKRDRIALQTHVPLLPEYENSVTLVLRPEGYCGIADVGGGLMNLCLVSTRTELADLRQWACTRWGISSEMQWRSLAPLNRRPARSEFAGLLLAGDAARVVEPFTGEGIRYAIQSGELAAKHIIHDQARWPDVYAREHAQLYSGRLWLNKLTRHAVEHPTSGSLLLRLGRRSPLLLHGLVARVLSAATRCHLPGV
jgi:geranylgeranyl reductase family protein